MRPTISICLLLVAAIHLLPSIGVLGPERLEKLYGVAGLDKNLLLLLRHRAVLFFLLGMYLLFAAFKEAHQPIAIVAGLVSVLSFLVLAWQSPELHPLLKRVVKVDLVALLALLVTVGVRFLAAKTQVA